MASAKTIHVMRLRATDTRKAFVRHRPKSTMDASRDGTSRHATTVASGWMANATVASPCSKATIARVEPQQGHGTPERRFSGQSVKPKTCATYIMAATKSAAKTARATSVAQTPFTAARSLVDQARITKSLVWRPQSPAYRLRQPSRNTPAHTRRRSCSRQRV